MNKSSFITIGIPFYNSEDYLEEAICSVLAQSHKNWELLLVDDGSTDNSLSIAKKYKAYDSRIKVIGDGTNKKLPYRLNQIIKESKSEFIARMDADDLMSPYRLEKQISYLYDNSNIDLVSTGILSLKNDLSLVGYRIPPNKVITIDDAIIGTTGIIHASILARKAWYERNNYNETMLLAEDYDLWIRAFLNNDLKVGFIEKPLYYYREDQSIKLEKLLKAYNTQIEIIKSIPPKHLSLFNKLKYISKIKAKKVVAKKLFFFNLEGLLHKRRVQIQSIDSLQKNLTNEISLIRKEKQL